MEVNHMKPFITPDISADGRKLLKLQCENIESEKIPKYPQDLSIIAYSMPEGHSLQAAWIFRLIFSNEHSLEFSSACTMVDSFQEAGSLNIKLISRAVSENPEIDAVLVRIDIPHFQIKSMVKLTYEGDNFCSECGIAFGCANGEEIVIATGISPGSVSIAAPFSTSAFETEFSISKFNRNSF